MGRDEQAIGAEESAKKESAGSEGSAGSGSAKDKGPSETHMHSGVPEDADMNLDPSSPGETGTTPGTNGK